MSPVLLFACANAMKDSGPNLMQIALLAACGLGILGAISLWLHSNAKRREAEKVERFRDLDGEG